MSDTSTPDIVNVTNEILVVGSMYKSPDLYITYGIMLRSKYDFTDPVTKFLYDCFEVYYTNFSQSVTAEQINTFMTQDETRLARYNKYGGFEVIEKWMNLANPDDFANYFDMLKKYSLLREYDKIGYNIQRIMSHPQFDKLTAEGLYKLIRGSADRIYTKVSASKDSVSLSEQMPAVVADYLNSPQMGIEYPWYSLTEMFRGMRKGKVVLNGFLSNEGKSRNLMMLMAYVALVKGEKFLLMSNEMSEEDLRSALITTVLNNEEFRKLHKVKLVKPEREIVLGLYRDESGKFIKRKEDEDGNFTESQSEYVARVHSNSEEFRQVLAVSEWVEKKGGKNILFKDVGSGYSDELLEHEIKRHHLVYGVDYFGYDTLKGYKTDDWQTLKQTTTRLKEIMKELDTFMWAVFQLTDDTVFTDFFDMSSNNIANAKQIKHVVDYLILGKRIARDQYRDLEYLPANDWGDAKPQPLDPNKQYFGMIVDKNRGGSKHLNPLFEYDLDLNLWNNIGSLKRVGL